MRSSLLCAQFRPGCSMNISTPTPPAIRDFNSIEFLLRDCYCRDCYCLSHAIANPSDFPTVHQAGGGRPRGPMIKVHTDGAPFHFSSSFPGTYPTKVAAGCYRPVTSLLEALVFCSVFGIA